MAKSFANAYAGMAYSARTQRNVKIHLAAAALVLVASAIFRVSLTELAVLILCIVVVLVAEMLNTALECAVDLVTTEYHPLAKIAKDVSAGALFVASIGVAGVGGVIFVPKLWQLLFGVLLPYVPEFSPVGKLV